MNVSIRRISAHLEYQRSITFRGIVGRMRRPLRPASPAAACRRAELERDRGRGRFTDAPGLGAANWFPSAADRDCPSRGGA